MLVPITKELFRKYLTAPRQIPRLEWSLEELIAGYCCYCIYYQDEMCESEDIMIEDNGRMERAIRDCESYETILEQLKKS